MSRKKPVAKATCAVCSRDPERVNGEFSECSHVDCPSRRKHWSEGVATGNSAKLREQSHPFDRMFDRKN